MVPQPNSSAIRTAAIYILHCWKTCAFGQILLFVGAELELDPFLPVPIVELAAPRRPMTVSILRVEGGLAQPLLVNAGLVQQLVRDDGVVHSHAAFVEDSDDGLFPLQPVANFPGQLAQGGREL